MFHYIEHGTFFTTIGVVLLHLASVVKPVFFNVGNKVERILAWWVWRLGYTVFRESAKGGTDF